MPTMANMTVKKADGTTDITYTAMAPSGGDRSTALWRATTSATFAAGQNSLTCSAKDAAQGKQRVVNWKLVVPYNITNTTTNQSTVADQVIISVAVTVPKGVPDSIAQEAAAQFGNLMDHALAVACNTLGFSPTA